MADLCDDCGAAMPNAAGPGLYCQRCGHSPIEQRRARLANLLAIWEREQLDACRGAFNWETGPFTRPRPTLADVR